MIISLPTFSHPKRLLGQLISFGINESPLGCTQFLSQKTRELFPTVPPFSPPSYYKLLGVVPKMLEVGTLSWWRKKK